MSDISGRIFTETISVFIGVSTSERPLLNPSPTDHEIWKSLFAIVSTIPFQTLNLMWRNMVNPLLRNGSHQKRSLVGVSVNPRTPRVGDALETSAGLWTRFWRMKEYWKKYQFRLWNKAEVIPDSCTLDSDHNVVIVSNVHMNLIGQHGSALFQHAQQINN